MKWIVLLIVLSFGSCKDNDYVKGYEQGTFNCVYWNKVYGDYPSYGFRQYLRHFKISLPHDSLGIDGVYKKYLRTMK